MDEQPFEIYMDASKLDRNSVRSQALSTRDHDGAGVAGSQFFLPRPQTRHRGSSGVKDTVRTGSSATASYCGTIPDQPILQQEQ